MFKPVTFFAFFIITIAADPLIKKSTKTASLKPMSVCCDIPELGDPQHLETCSHPKLPGPCNDVNCVFMSSGFMLNKSTLNKEAYTTYLRQWVQDHMEWEVGIEKAITDCVEKDIRQYLDTPCKAYDVFACTGIAMLKKCPESAWRC